MALLDLMIWQGRENGFEVRAVTVDHGLREAARDEIALVAAYCAERRVSHDVLTWSWGGRGNLQAEARAARYGLIAEWATARQIGRVALGHTENDVAETFLMRLARKAGVDGLAKMERKFERDKVIWLRPLLGLSRETLRDYLIAQGIGWAEDDSNRDRRFERVRVREVLETLEPLGIDVHALSSVAQNIWLAKATLEHYVRDVQSKYVTELCGDLLLPDSLPDKSGELIPHEIMFRLRREAIRWIGGADYVPRGDAMETLDIAMHRRETHTLGGCVFMPMKDRKCRVIREYNAVKGLVSPTCEPWDGRWVLDGPHDPALQIRALGEAVKDTPWRETGAPRASLMATPAVWQGSALIAAPVAGMSNGWTAEATGRGTFAAFLLSR